MDADIFREEDYTDRCESFPFLFDRDAVLDQYVKFGRSPRPGRREDILARAALPRKGCVGDIARRALSGHDLRLHASVGDPAAHRRSTADSDDFLQFTRPQRRSRARRILRRIIPVGGDEKSDRTNIQDVATVRRDGVDIEVCAAHEREECHVCFMSFTQVNEELRFRHQTRKNCDRPNCGGQRTGSLKKCSGCLNAWYCDENCQRTHWSEHKPTCEATGFDLQIEEGKPPVKRLLKGHPVQAKFEGGKLVPFTVVRFFLGLGPYKDPMVAVNPERYPNYVRFDDWCRYSDSLKRRDHYGFM